ncbi:unnamed protein product, partial [Rangifer tarandus platyrhynchus]
APRQGAAICHAAQPARRDRRTCTVRSAAGGKAVWPAPRAKALGVGWGGGALSTSPRPQPSDPTSRELAGRSGGRGTPETTPPRGAGLGWRGARPGMEVRRGGREGGGEAPFPPDSHSARRPPPSCAAPHPLPPERPTDPTARPGRAAFQRSFPPFLPIPRRTGGGEAHDPGETRRGHREALRTDRVNDPSA